MPARTNPTGYSGIEVNAALQMFRNIQKEGMLARLAGRSPVFPTTASATSSDLNRTVTDPGDHPIGMMPSVADAANRRHAHRLMSTASE